MARLVDATKQALAQGYTRYQREMIFLFWMERYIGNKSSRQEGHAGDDALFVKKTTAYHSVWPLMKNVKAVLWNHLNHPTWYKLAKDHFCHHVSAEPVD